MKGGRKEEEKKGVEKQRKGKKGEQREEMRWDMTSPAVQEMIRMIWYGGLHCLTKITSGVGNRNYKERCMSMW